MKTYNYQIVYDNGSTTEMLGCASRIFLNLALDKPYSRMEFTRAGRNCVMIINMDHVESTDGEVFRMKDGQDYPIRIRGRAKVLSDFSRYQFSRMRGTFMKHGEAK